MTELFFNLNFMDTNNTLEEELFEEELFEDMQEDLDNLEKEEEDENLWHRVITSDSSIDWEDNFFDEWYFEK